MKSIVLGVLSAITAIIIVFTCLFCCGCTTSKISYVQSRSSGPDTWTTSITGERTSFAQKILIFCGIDTNGYPCILYSTDGGAEPVGSAAGSALKAIAR